MVLTILWQVYMFLSAYESIQAWKMMEELLGQVKARILEVYRLEFQVETRAQAMEKRKTEWRKQLQSSFVLLKHFPKSIFCMLYPIWKLRKSRIQRFKPCMIWSWNEEDMSFGRQLHQNGNTISQGDFLHGAKFGHFAPWRKHLAKFRKVDLGTLRNAFEIPCFETLLMLFHCRFSKIFCLIFSFVNTYFTL